MGLGCVSRVSQGLVDLLTVEHNNITFLDPLLSEDTSESLNLMKQLTIGVCFPRVGDGTVKVDGDRFTMAIENVTINTVVASGDLTVREPLPAIMGNTALEGLLGQPNGSREWFVPVKVLGLVAPKVFSVCKRVLEHLVLDMVVVIVGHGWFLSWAVV